MNFVQNKAQNDHRQLPCDKSCQENGNVGTSWFTLSELVPVNVCRLVVPLLDLVPHLGEQETQSRSPRQTVCIEESDGIMDMSDKNIKQEPLMCIYIFIHRKTHLVICSRIARQSRQKFLRRRSVTLSSSSRRKRF